MKQKLKCGHQRRYLDVVRDEPLPLRSILRKHEFFALIIHHQETLVHVLEEWYLCNLLPLVKVSRDFFRRHVLKVKVVNNGLELDLRF